jgi:hypothetical protein
MEVSSRDMEKYCRVTRPLKPRGWPYHRPAGPNVPEITLGRPKGAYETRREQDIH